MLMQRFTCCFLFLFAACSVDPSPSPESDFLRFVEEGEHTGRLETAIVTYENNGGVRVDLIAAVHLADPGYYEHLMLFFSAYDALLYELILDSGAQVSRANTTDSLLSRFQRNLCRAMDLSFQLDAIDYGKPNFVHADLTVREFRRLWDEKGETVLGIMFKAMVAQAKAMEKGAGSIMTPEAMMDALRSKDSAERFKFLLAQEFENIEYLLAALDGGEEGEESVLLGERNKAAIRVLQERIGQGDRKIGLLYGAGHMPDLEVRLVRDLGFRKTGQEWFTAWEIGCP